MAVAGSFMNESNAAQRAWTLSEAVRRGAREYPQRTALRFAAEQLTYGELDGRANCVANGLLSWRLPHQSRVAFLDLNSLQFFETFFGAAKAGCAFVGVNARLAPQEVCYVLNDATAAVLFVGREHVALVESIESQLETVQHIVALDGGHARWPDFVEWRNQHAETEPRVEVSEDDDVIQLYTSGTTGHPKGACHTHRTWRAFSEAVQAAGWASYGADTVTFVCMPLFHVAGFNLSTLTLLGGGTAIISRRFDVEEILELIPRARITDTLFVPTMIHELLSHPRAATTDFSSLRHLSYGAAPIADALLDRAQQLFGQRFVHLYGMTECLGGATYLPPAMHQPALGKQRSCGRGYAGLEVRIVDPAGHVVPPNTSGEIVVRCPWLMRGYWRNSNATDEAIRDGWLYTGDAGFLDADGYLYIQDRVKDMIVSGGENIYPAEVENAILGHPDLAEVAVIGVPDPKWGESVKALVVLKPNAVLDVDSVLRYARDRIAGYKLPKSIEAVAALPRNASGKVLRRKLREPYWQGREQRLV